MLVIHCSKPSIVLVCFFFYGGFAQFIPAARVNTLSLKAGSGKLDGRSWDRFGAEKLLCRSGITVGLILFSILQKCFFSVKIKGFFPVIFTITICQQDINGLFANLYFAST